MAQRKSKDFTLGTLLQSALEPKSKAHGAEASKWLHPPDADFSFPEAVWGVTDNDLRTYVPALSSTAASEPPSVESLFQLLPSVVQFATEKKNAGNRLFGANEFEAAWTEYQSGLSALFFARKRICQAAGSAATLEADAKFSQMALEAEVPLMVNGAAAICQLVLPFPGLGSLPSATQSAPLTNAHRRKLTAAATLCSRSLTFMEADAGKYASLQRKALYRKAKASLALGDVEAARAALTQWRALSVREGQDASEADAVLRQFL